MIKNESEHVTRIKLNGLPVWQGGTGKGW